MTRRPSYAQYDRDYFDGGKAYQTYTESWVWQAIPEMACYLLNEPRSVLDFGCAKGYLVKNLVARDVNAKGVDVSHYAINNTPPEIRDRFKVLNSPTLPFGDRKFEWVFSFETLEHIPPEDIDDTLREFRRVATAGVFGSIFLEGQTDGVDPTRVLVRSREWWNRKFREHGFYEDFEVVLEAKRFPCIRALGVEPICYRRC